MEEKLREYAKLVIEIGLNVQKDQTLIISSPVECAHFARLCAGAAYDAARAYRGGGSAPGRFAVGIHGAPL